MPRRRALALLAAVVLASPAGAAELAVPDPALTPGAVASHDLAEVCAQDASGRYTYSPTHRGWRSKPDTLAKYGVPLSQDYLYEDDDRVPLCLGGDNADPRNHWAQPWPEAREKDQLEAVVRRMVCNEHLMSLGEAQAAFRNDWRALYRSVFGRSP